MAQAIDTAATKLSESETRYIYGPMVLEGGLGNRPVFIVTLVDDENGAVVNVADAMIVRSYSLESVDDFTVEPNAPKITFKSQGTIYTVRRFQDSDGTWASMTGAAVPAQALEEIFMNDVVEEATPELAGNYADEALQTLSSGDGKVAYLIYTGADKTYSREDGEWVALDDPNGDLLDGYYIDDVSPGFVDYYDKNSKKGITADDVDNFNGNAEVGVTASASAQTYRFAPAPKKKD
jgi:hypothetical protein